MLGPSSSADVLKCLPCQWSKTRKAWEVAGPVLGTHFGKRSPLILSRSGQNMASPNVGYREGGPPPAHWGSQGWEQALPSLWSHQSLASDWSIADIGPRDFHAQSGLLLAQSSPALGRALQQTMNRF